MRHGTVTGYNARCRCEPCRAAWRDYTREWTRDKRAGRYRTRDAAEARAHLLRLIDEGQTVGGIESLSGLSDTTVLSILKGKTKRVRHATAEAIIGVTLGAVPGEHCLTPSQPARRLLAQMRRSGIQAKEVSAWLGYGPTSSIPAARHERIVVRNHRRVCVLYELLARQGLVPAQLLDEVTATTAQADRDDHGLWSEEAISDALYIFSPRTCSTCGRVLPANRDYFAPDKKPGSGALTYNCRRCRRAGSAASYERSRAGAG